MIEDKFVGVMDPSSLISAFSEEHNKAIAPY